MTNLAPGIRTKRRVKNVGLQPKTLAIVFDSIPRRHRCPARVPFHRHLLPALCFLLFLVRSQLPAAEPSDQEVLKALTQEQPRDKAVKAGLDFLRRQQRPDGSASERYATAFTAMAVMAHFAAGHPPADRQYGPWLAKSINYVLSKQNADGYLGEADGSRMYGHGIATLMLAEALGMPRDDELDEAIRKALKKAAQVTVTAAMVAKSPEHAGGWRYTPDSTDSDLSLSGWQLMSLHATQQVGISVPESVIAGAVAYTLRTVGPDGKVGYQSPNDDHPALRGLALLALVIGHQEQNPLIKRIVERIRSDPIAWKGDHFYYRVYYDAVGVSRALPQEWDQYLLKLRGRSLASPGPGRFLRLVGGQRGPGRRSGLHHQHGDHGPGRPATRPARLSALIKSPFQVASYASIPYCIAHMIGSTKLP